MYMKTFMCTTAIQITYKRDNPSHLLRYVKNYYKTLFVYKIYGLILNLLSEGLKKTPHGVFSTKISLSFCRNLKKLASLDE